MAKKLTKLELVAALAAAGVSVSPSATVMQLRSLYDSENLRESGAPTANNNNSDDSLSEDDVDEAEIAKLEKRRKVLMLQKEVKALENELADGVQALSMTDLDNVVPKFTGDDAYSIEKWLSDFENAMKIGKSNSHFKYMSARRLLGGTAAVFLRTSTAANFNELKAELLQQFKRQVSIKDVYKALYSRRRQPSENILSYMFSMREIAAQADIEEKEVIDAIIEGLGDKSAHTSILYTAKNFEEFKNLLLTYEKRRPNIATAARVSKPTIEVRCYNCSKLGHLSSQCVQPKREMGACFRCNQSGHQIKDCPKKSTAAVHVVQQEDEVQPIDFNQKVSVAFDKRVNSNFIDCLSLIDSGSPISLVCKNVLPFDVTNDVQITLPYCGLGGTKIRSYGQIDANISINNQCKSLSFYIISDNLLQKPILLGRDFLKLFNIQLCIINNSSNNYNKNSNITYEKDNQLNLVHIPKIVFNCSGDLVYAPVNNGNAKIDLLISDNNSKLGGSDIGNLTDSELLNKFNSEKIDPLNSELDTSVSECPKVINTDCFQIENDLLICEIELDQVDNELFDLGPWLPAEKKTIIKNIIDNCYLKCPKIEIEKPVEISIELTSTQPVYTPPRRLSSVDKAKCQEIIDDLLNQGIIRHSCSPYASPVVLVKKRNGDTRMCIDYRELNKITVRDHYPLPLIDDCIDYLGGKNLFTLLDLKSGFHQVKVAENSIKYTSFVTPIGQFEYVMMPFGLCNAPSVFQRFINFILKDFIVQSQIIAYMDDILIASESFDEHRVILGKVLRRLAEYGLELKLSKCKFCHTNIEYLGYDVDQNGIKPNDRHKKNILNYPIPKNVKQLQAFVGLCAYFRKFIPQFSRMAKPLYDLLKKNEKFIMSEECLNRIEILKHKLVNCPVLAIYNPNRETELHCDASAMGFGAVLLQRQEDKKFHPIFYYSKRTSAAEAKYHGFELETLAIIYALRRFRVYLEGIAFKIITDCNALTLTLNKKIINPRIARWALELQNYNYIVQHREGSNMGHVDALSRSEIILAIDNTEIEFQLCATQSRDPEIIKLRDLLEKGEVVNFELQDGLVYRKTNRGELNFYVPREMEDNTIRTIHEKIGHLGITKTYDFVRKNYWFPNMKDKVEKFVKNCLKCIVYSAPARVNERNIHSIPKKPLPFDTIHIDHLGPLPCIKSKRKHVLVVVDAFTKYVKLYPANSTSTKEVIESLKKYFCYYSRPRRIVSDRGSCFTSLEFSKFLLNNNIEHVKVAVGSPQANGQVERANRVITPMLSKLSEPIQHSDWSLKLSDIEFALNNTVHCSTGKTPAQLLFGVTQRGVVVDEITEFFEDQKSVQERDLEQVRKEASVAIEKSQQHNEELFNKTHKPAREFSVGEFVVMKNVDTRH